MTLTVSATELKHRLGEVLDRATFVKVGIERHGRVIAYLVPADGQPRRPRSASRSTGLTRAQEERLLELVASGDLRPSRWRRAGDPRLLGGMAALLASAGVGDPSRLFALAERLSPGVSTVKGLERWLENAPVDPSRFLPMLEARVARTAARRDS